MLQPRKILGAIVFFSVLSFSTAFGTTLPPNDMHLEDDLRRIDANIDETLFNEIIDRALVTYVPLAKKHGAGITVNREWENPMVNASAGRLYKFWMLNFYGGLARRPEMTPDGFALVVCHELGHLFAGYPFKRTMFGRLVWHSIEGEADYYATHVCARELWKEEKEVNSLHSITVDPWAKIYCDQAWPTVEQRDLCYRIANASQSLASLLSRGKSDPLVNTPDPAKVRKTFTKHPAAQCRLDTYMNGALCPAEFHLEKIPGKKYVPWLRSLKKAEREAALVSCHQAKGDEVGVRPQCWFRPRKDLF